MKNLLLILFIISISSSVKTQSLCPNLFKCGDTLTDTRDNYKYPTLQIGTQCWFKINLYATKYLNGDSIPHITNDVSWANLSTGAWCDQMNNADTGLVYGHLYNEFAILDSRSICPQGWYVPTYNEWNILVNYLGGLTAAGIAMKAGPSHWYEGNRGTNSSGFTALPGGWRCGTPGSWDCWNTNYNGTFTYQDYDTELGVASLSNSTHAYFLMIDYTDVPAVIIGPDNPMTLGVSVRCVKDN